DLPLPLGPTSRTRSPGATVRSSRSRTGLLPWTGVQEKSRNAIVTTSRPPGGERVERARASQRPHQQPASGAGDEQARDDEEAQVGQPPRQVPVDVVVVPLVEGGEHGRQGAA